MFGLIWAIIIGFIAGFIARAIHPGNDKLGFWLTAGLGIAGSLGAKLVLGIFVKNPNVGFVGSVLGAVAILAIYSYIQKKRLR